MGELLKSAQPCPDCGSSDALAVYDNGTHCFSCNESKRTAEGATYRELVPQQDNSYMLNQIKNYPSAAMPERGITEDIAKKYGVKVEANESTGLPEKYFFPYYKDGKIVGYKVRHVNEKKFYSVGNISGAELFGSQVVGENGKLIIITEGEMDTLAAYQMMKESGKNYKVVSLPNGANIKSIKENLEFLEGFETVMLNFDKDDVGQKASKDAQEVLSIGKVRVIDLPVKDANELLLSSEHRNIEYLQAVNAAKTVRPDGIIDLANSWDLMFSDDAQESVLYPWKGLNDKLYGMRKREIITLTSGSGMGKSAVTRELTHHLLKSTEDNIGVLALEESVQRTAWGIVSVEANLPLSIREERRGVSKEDIKRAFDNTIGTGRIFTLDHFGSTSEDTLLSRVRYMIKAMDCEWI